MSPVSLLLELRQRGARFITHGDRLRFRAPVGSVSPELIAAFREAKPVLRSIVLAEQANCPIPDRPCRGVCNGRHMKFWFSGITWACSICHPPGDTSSVLTWHEVAQEAAVAQRAGETQIRA